MGSSDIPLQPPTHEVLKDMSFMSKIRFTRLSLRLAEP